MTIYIFKITRILMVTKRILDSKSSYLQAIQEETDICPKKFRIQWIIIESSDEQTFSHHLPEIQCVLKFQVNFFKIRNANDHHDIIAPLFYEKKKKTHLASKRR